MSPSSVPTLAMSGMVNLSSLPVGKARSTVSAPSVACLAVSRWVGSLTSWGKSFALPSSFAHSTVIGGGELLESPASFPSLVS